MKMSTALSTWAPAFISLMICTIPAHAVEGKAKGLLKDWALARCIGKSAPDEIAGDDAIKSAGALLERGSTDIEIYNRIDVLVQRYLDRHYGGSVPGNYNTLKCLDLYHSRDLDMLIARYSGKR